MNKVLILAIAIVAFCVMVGLANADPRDHYYYGPHHHYYYSPPVYRPYYSPVVPIVPPVVAPRYYPDYYYPYYPRAGFSFGIQIR